jgi:parallel beta-helix repeat protein
VWRTVTLVSDCARTRSNSFSHCGRANAKIKTNSSPIFLRCEFLHGSERGIIVCGGSCGTFIDCDIADNVQSGIKISNGSNPKFLRCKIHDGGSAGILIHNKGEGYFEVCCLSLCVCIRASVYFCG